MGFYVSREESSKSNLPDIAIQAKEKIWCFCEQEGTRIRLPQVTCWTRGRPLMTGTD